MSRRVVAVILALAVAVAGGLVILSYVAGADRRALSDLEPVSVLKVVTVIPAGTPAEQIGDSVTRQEVPAAAAVPGVLGELNDIAGQVTTVELQPGEQLIQARFVDPAELEAAGEVDVPEDFQQMSILLEPARVLGGYLVPGDTVGVYVSMTDPPQTRQILPKVLVARVQGGLALPDPASNAATTLEETAQAAPEDAETVDPQAQAPPAQGILVTLAMSTADTELVVFGQEHGTVWLSIDPQEAPDPDGVTTERETIYP
ncbi:MAG: RcpC/CpaB family pilus assembly protein [Ornithinimicrobium sp.]